MDKLKSWVPFGLLGGSSADKTKEGEAEGKATAYQVLMLFVLEILRYDLEWDDEDLWNRQVLRL